MKRRTAAQGGGQVPGRWSVAAYMAVLALVTLVPSFVFAGILMNRNQAGQEAVVETLIVATTRSLVQAVEREISANITTLRVLATTPSLHEGDFADFHARVRLALEGTEANLFVINEDYSTLLSTRQPYGAESVPTADIESARIAFETGEVVVTDLVLGAVSRQWVYNILKPVDLGAFGPKVLALNQPATNFARALLTNRLPEGWHTALLDEKGQIIAASLGAGATGEVFAVFDVMAQPYAPGWQGVGTEAGAYRTVIQRSGTTDWRLVSWAPESVIARPLMETMLSLVAGAIILALIIVGTLYWVSRRIGSSVQGLARDARRLGLGEKVSAKPYPVAEIAEVSAALADASSARQAAEADVRFLMRELAHRSKNQMTVIAAMAKQTARGEEDVQHYVQNFEKRILGLARSTDLLLAHGRAGVELEELVTHQIAPFAPADAGRVTIEGESVRLNAQAAQIVGMASHELATNAVKYGAFSRDAGTLSVSWRIAGDRLDFVWRETAENAAPHGDRKGFGTTVINSMVGRALEAEVERICHPDGIEWRFAIPLASLHPDYGGAEPEEDEPLAGIEREAALG